ncbi:MAG: ArnT family glycosyltransferase [Nitrospinales bacterium]
MSAPNPEPLNVRYWPALALAAVAYLLTRCYAITLFPVFTDEAIYIHWAQIIADDAHELFISKVDGKQPLFMWLNALTLGWFADPLVAGRTVSILAGGFSLAGVYLIGRRLYGPAVGIVAAWCYVFLPYTLLFDRLALVDSLLSALGVWIFLVAWSLARSPDRRYSGYLLLGVLLGLSLLTKATGLLFFPVVAMVFLLYRRHRQPGLAVGAGLALLAAAAVILPFFLAGQGIMVQERTLIFHRSDLVLSWDELLSFPWLIWLRNVLVIWEFYYTYLTWPVVVVLAFAVFLVLAERKKTGLALLSWAVLPTLAIVVVAKGFFSRYFVLGQPPLAILAALALVRLAQFLSTAVETRTFFSQWSSTVRVGAVSALLLLLTLSDGFFFTWRLTHDPLNTPVHEFDRTHYLEGMNSGYGIAEALKFLKQESRRGEVVLMISTNPGNPQEGLEIYLRGQKNVVIVPTVWWPQHPRLIPPSGWFPFFASKYKRRPQNIQPTSRLRNAYFVYPFVDYPREKFLAANPEFKKVWSYRKPDPQYSLDIFKRDGGNS